MRPTQELMRCNGGDTAFVEKSRTLAVKGDKKFGSSWRDYVQGCFFFFFFLRREQEMFAPDGMIQ